MLFLPWFPVIYVLLLVAVFLQSVAANKLETCSFELMFSIGLVGQC